jgi:hypothetical protein
MFKMGFSFVEKFQIRIMFMPEMETLPKARSFRGIPWRSLDA